MRGAVAVAERPDGTRVLFTPYPTPILDEDGAMIGAVNMLIDVTDDRQAEALDAEASALPPPRLLDQRRADLRTLRLMAEEYDDKARGLRAAERTRPTLDRAVAIAPLQPADRAEWEMLARGYKAFYEDPVADSVYDAVWARLMDGGRCTASPPGSDGAMIGIVHYLFHAHTWHGETCYLQDLFTAPEARGKRRGARADRCGRRGSEGSAARRASTG